MLKCYFNRELYPEELWFPDHWHLGPYLKYIPYDNPLIAEAIWTVDRTKYLGPDQCDSPIFGRMSFDRLSGTCKTLICMLTAPYFFFKSSWMGDNAAPVLEKIAKEQDVQLLCVHNFHFTDTQEIYFPQYDEHYVGAYQYRLAFRKHYDDYKHDTR